MILNSVRMVDHDQAREYSFGDYKTLKENLAIAIINPEDFKKLNLSTNFNIRINSQYGEVILHVQQDKNIPQGMINVPVSIWANQLTGIIGKDLIFKGLKVNVESTKDNITNFDDLISKIKSKE
ncbi:MAG: molybdopterin dinucleotide binding domain-containing protein [Promethearchaeota archaeon]